MLYFCFGKQVSVLNVHDICMNEHSVNKTNKYAGRLFKIEYLYMVFWNSNKNLSLLRFCNTLFMVYSFMCFPCRMLFVPWQNNYSVVACLQLKRSYSESFQSNYTDHSTGSWGHTDSRVHCRLAAMRCLIDWVKSSNFISWLLHNRNVLNAQTCETVNKSSKSKIFAI